MLSSGTNLWIVVKFKWHVALKGLWNGRIQGPLGGIDLNPIPFAMQKKKILRLNRCYCLNTFGFQCPEVDGVKLQMIKRRHVLDPLTLSFLIPPWDPVGLGQTNALDRMWPPLSLLGVGMGQEGRKVLVAVDSSCWLRENCLGLGVLWD